MMNTRKARQGKARGGAVRVVSDMSRKFRGQGRLDSGGL